MKSDLEFNDYMDLPHLRPAYGVNAPALFRHIGVRIAGHHNDPLRATSLNDSKKLRDSYIADLNVVLDEIQQTCGATRKFLFGTNVGGRISSSTIWVDPRKTLLTVLNLRGDANSYLDLTSWRIRLRVDIHTEYYYVTLILDQKSEDDLPESIGSAKLACEYEKKLCEQISTARQPDEVMKLIDFFY